MNLLDLLKAVDPNLDENGLVEIWAEEAAQVEIHFLDQENKDQCYHMEIAVAERVTPGNPADSRMIIDLVVMDERAD